MLITLCVLLTGQHPSGTLGLLYKTVWQGLLPVVLEADLPPPTPTAVAVFPVVVHGGKTQQTENIVVAGFSDGGLRFYKSVSNQGVVGVYFCRVINGTTPFLSTILILVTTFMYVCVVDVVGHVFCLPQWYAVNADIQLHL